MVIIFVIKQLFLWPISKKSLSKDLLHNNSYYPFCNMFPNVKNSLDIWEGPYLFQLDYVTCMWGKRAQTKSQSSLEGGGLGKSLVKL